MAELESVIEQKLIDQLVYGDSQWTYRADLKTEEDLWNNFRYILVQNNKDRLNGEPLSDTEFEQVKNQLQFSSFYKAGEWLVGENGKVMVHVQRDTERLHLVVMNHEHIAGGSSVYEVINQYRALADEESQTKAQDRRFDVTLMINGLPMIHIELKNKQHSYMDGFWQIKKYIGEGKFTGIFSAVQMFVISNGVDTKYFSAASDTELNSKFISGWLDNENNPVPDYLDFAKSVLRIPEAHEMIARYTVLDEEAKRLILLRPYQIHAIEAIREASKTGKSGFVWHTTGSGKTLTSYKATRNLLMDIPSIDKAIFLIDRKDLDTQTSMAFRTYANNDLVDVDQTDNVFDLKKKLKSDDRQMIVTTIQKLQRLITKKLAEGTLEYNKIKSLKIAFVVDECHRAVTPGTKRELERFFANSLWYGFTGTPIFKENKRKQLGDLAQTTHQQYGERLHEYTVKEAIHDGAVLGFKVDYRNTIISPIPEKDLPDSVYEDKEHMLEVLDAILNKSYQQLGFPNGVGKTYEAILTVKSIPQAQTYYNLLKSIKAGQERIKVSERAKRVLPDFPKMTVTYSVSENEEESIDYQNHMKQVMDDYNQEYGTHFTMADLRGFNTDINNRLARKLDKYIPRNEQLDLVIVVDRLLTGFDAPCLSTLFIDRKPMRPQDLIQAFSRTNRIFDSKKRYGHIITFQRPEAFKEAVDNALRLYSNGGENDVTAPAWDEEKANFIQAWIDFQVKVEDVENYVITIEQATSPQLRRIAKAYQTFDKYLASIRVYSEYDEAAIYAETGLSDEKLETYLGIYQNILAELKSRAEDDGDDNLFDIHYELESVQVDEINYAYILTLIQSMIQQEEDSPQALSDKDIETVDNYIQSLERTNPKLAEIIRNLWKEVQANPKDYQGQPISDVLNTMIEAIIDDHLKRFAREWYVGLDELRYYVQHYRKGAKKQSGESQLTKSQRYKDYKAETADALNPLSYKKHIKEAYTKLIEEVIEPLRVGR